MNTQTVAQPDVATTEQVSLRARLLAQMLLIEQYRCQQRADFGRMLSRDEAASEWIARFAADFPSLSA